MLQWWCNHDFSVCILCFTVKKLQCKMKSLKLRQQICRYNCKCKFNNSASIANHNIKVNIYNDSVNFIMHMDTICLLMTFPRFPQHSALSISERLRTIKKCILYHVQLQNTEVIYMILIKFDDKLYCHFINKVNLACSYPHGHNTTIYSLPSAQQVLLML